MKRQLLLNIVKTSGIIDSFYSIYLSLQTGEVASAIKKKSNNFLSVAETWTIICLHFQQTLLIEAWPPSYHQVRNQSPTALGSTITGSISMGSNSIFDDDVGGKTVKWLVPQQGEQLILHMRDKDNSAHEGLGKFCTWGIRINWIVSSLKLKIFINEIRDKVRNAFKNNKNPFSKRRC